MTEEAIKINATGLQEFSFSQIINKVSFLNL